MIASPDRVGRTVADCRVQQNFVNGLHQLLLQATGQQNPDTSLIKAATAQLNTQYYKNEACIPALAQILASAPDQAVSST